LDDEKNGRANDPTRRNEPEAVPTETDRRLRWLVEVSEDLICTHDPEGRVLSANPAMVRLTGYSEEELIGHSLSGFLSLSTRREFRAYLETILRDGHAEGFMRIVARDGKERVLQYENVLQTDRSGERLIFGVAHDVQRKWAENALRLSVSRLEALLNNMPDAAWMKDDQGRFTTVNDAFARILGRSHRKIIGKTLRELVAPEIAEKSEAEDRIVLETGKILQVSDELVWPGDKQIIFETIKTPIEGGGRPSGLVGIARDITERRRLEDQLLQSQKMEAIGRLAGGIAHDFNNILTSILGYCDLVLWQLDEGSAIRADVEEIERAGNRAALLTRQLLAFGRKQVIEPRVIELNDVVLDAGKMLRRLIGENIEFVTAPGADLGHVRVDPGQLEQVLINLAVNARDAMPAGGRLLIETRNVERSEAPASDAFGAELGRSVMLAVTDTGSGMDAETLRHIFEPFYTTKDRGKGTGLGLATVYGIVRQNSGTIRVHSEVGNGTRFEVYLPRVDDPVPAAAPARPAAVPPGGSETILLVEDEEAVRALTSRALQTAGYIVLVARDAADAERISREYSGSIEILITDVIMPRISGPQLARLVFAKRPQLRVLYMSGYIDTAMAEQVGLNSEAPQLTKPFTASRLIEKVREVLDQPGRGGDLFAGLGPG
jgi:PAS domain S-box-containing protein